MKTTAAVLFEAGKPFELMELDLDGPGPGEVLVKYTAAGLCHSDLHLTDGDLPPRFPIVGGHEGSGVIEEVGAGVTRVKPGDHVVCSFIPNCGTCRYCCTGRQNLCDMGATILEGCMPDGSFRFHSQGTDFGAMCMLGTFAERATVSQHSVVKVDDWLPLETAVLVGCGVPSGWGTAVNAGNLRAGDTAVIYGVGGLGINAVQGATAAGCKYVVVVDPVAFKRETALKFRRHPCLRRRPPARRPKVDELTALEVAAEAAQAAGELVSVQTIERSVDKAAVRYDRDGDQHYDVVSAFIKSVRGSDVDAALHYLARMLVAGEDPRFIARRLMILASEDIGMAGPSALQVAVAAAQTVALIGMPEAQLTLAHATIHLATAPKSNAVTTALAAAMNDIKAGKAGLVPAHLRDGHYSGAAALGNAQGYKYSHDDPDGVVAQQYPPDELVDVDYYRPTGRGGEREIAGRLDRLRAIIRKKRG